MFHDHERHERGGFGPGWHMKGRRGDHGGSHHGGPFGGPIGGGRGGPFGGGRGRRMFDAGALRLVVLGLIAEEPRHGYDIIKALEATFQGAYSPSPGAIYPMLQMLEEADLVLSEADGNKRLYRVTEAGKAYIEENRADLDRINAQMQRASGRMGGAAIGEELRALHWAIRSKLRGGGWSAEQAEKARAILKAARRELEDL